MSRGCPDVRVPPFVRLISRAQGAVRRAALADPVYVGAGQQVFLAALTGDGPQARQRLDAAVASRGIEAGPRWETNPRRRSSSSPSGSCASSGKARTTPPSASRSGR